MRVINQTGNLDIPYEMSRIYVNESGIIQADMIGIPVKPLIMAQYSTYEKAKRAMEMLHEAYTGMIFMQNIQMTEDDMQELRKGIERGFGAISYCANSDNCKIEPLNTVFRFPQEDEI